MFFKKNDAKSSSSDPEHSYPVQSEPFLDLVTRKVRSWFGEYVPLFEAGAVAISAHILAFPLVWFVGWALPWPKSPEIVTVIEINLENWPNEAVPEKITDIYKSQMHGRK